MQLPFTHDQFLDVFADYNRALWPAVLLLWLATVWGLWLLYRGHPASSRMVAGILALHWAWAGGIYHWVFFRRINPAALVFGAGFVLQAFLFLWLGVIRPNLTFRPTFEGWGLFAATLIAYALFYPTMGWLFGLRFPRLPSFGVPCPTSLLTAGLLLLAPRREVRVLAIVPLVWSAIGGSAAFLLRIRADLALPLAALALLAYLLTRTGAKPSAA